MKKPIHSLGVAAIAGALAAIAGSAAAQPKSVAGVTCAAPPPAFCKGPGQCTADLFATAGNATDAKTGRKFFLDYPCDLKPGEKVTFILSLHGAGSIGNRHRHYFPIAPLKEKHRLVIATPSANIVGDAQTGMRMWNGLDDGHLQNITDMVFESFGKQNINAFWIAGHSQGGMTSNRIVCNDYFKDKADGWLSLSGGRIGRVQVAPNFGPIPVVRGAPPPAQNLPAGVQPGVATTPACDFNYIFTTGKEEIVALPETSPWAEKYRCGARVRREDIVDDQPGLMTGMRPGPPNPAWGREAKPGTAQVMVYPSCAGGKVVADVVRLDKGHTEALEPKVTEGLVKMMLAAPAGKLRGG